MRKMTLYSSIVVEDRVVAESDVVVLTAHVTAVKTISFRLW